LLLIGGSFIFCLYIYPKIVVFDDFPKRAIASIIEKNHRYAWSFINRAISYGEKGQIEKACADLKLACDSGYIPTKKGKSGNRDAGARPLVLRVEWAIQGNLAGAASPRRLTGRREVSYLSAVLTSI